MSKLIELLGVPEDIESYGSCLRVLRGLTTKYEQALAELQEKVRAHNA